MLIGVERTTNVSPAQEYAYRGDTRNKLRGLMWVRAISHSIRPGGLDASRIAEEVIAHLAGLVGSRVKVSLEIEAEVPDGVPENVVRIVTENSRTLRFTSHGFETE